MTDIKRNDGTKRQGSSLWRRATAATLAVGMLAGGASGVYADGKGKQENKNSGKATVQITSKSTGKGKSGLTLDFKDLNENQWGWAYSHIVRLASKQVFNGYEDGSFKPNNTISRIEALVAAVRLLGLKDEAEKPENMNATLNFSDFKKLQTKYPWAVGYVAVALEHDLFAESDAAVQPEKAADRLWAAVLLVKALKLDDEAHAKMATKLTFKDADQIPAGSVGYVAVAVEKGLITGYEDNTFRPNKSVSRAELAALLDRADEQLPDQGATAVTGTVQGIANGSVQVKKADGTVVSLPLDANVFVFRDEKKATAAALKSGDEVLVRTYQNKVVFIEVTKLAPTSATETKVTGTVGTITLNAQGKIVGISIRRTVDGVVSTTIYNVSDTVAISGNTLVPNQTVVLTVKNDIVTAIDVQTPA